ncbi:MAG TPA: TIR domain-containing protein [Gaiellaceae bacterium]|nr:TIR domain-containing protein [Gaiellaceae bacterium]
MADVFVSYSRRDGDFVHRLVDGLAEHGKDVWVDVDGVRDAEVFPAVLRSAVEQCDGFVFVISPDSVASGYCEQEVDHALELNKRIVPLLLRPVADESVPEGIRVRNWIPFAGETAFEPGLERVLEALDTDLDWAREHTRWLVKSIEWDGERREKSFLLRGSELAAAEGWLARTGKEPEPTALQREYVAASRLAATRRQRTMLGVAAGVAAVSLGLLVFALISRGQAIDARDTARSQALAAESETQVAVDPERAILLAVAAEHQKQTPEATFALRAALDASPIRSRLPDAGPQTCGVQQLAAPGVAFSPDGRRLAEGLCGGTVVIADPATGRVIMRIRVGSDPFGGAVAFSPDGRYLAACCRKGIVLLDPKVGAVRAVGPRLTGGAIVAAFDPKAPVLVVAQVGRLVFWNYDTGRRRVFSYPGRPAALSLSFSPDGRRLLVAVAGGGPTSPGLALIDVRTGRVLKTVDVGTSTAVYSPDGRSVAVAETTAPGYVGRVVLRSPVTLAPRRTLAQVTAVQPTALAFSPDGTRLAYGFADGTGGLVSVQSGQRLASYLGQTAAIVGVAFSPNGRLVATGSADGTTRLWRASGDEQQLIAARGTVDAAAASRPGIAAILEQPGGHGTALVVQSWSGPGLRPTKPFQISPTSNVDADFLSADGSLAGVVPAPANGSTAPIRIWNVARRRLVTTIPPGPSPVGGSPTFSPDGSLLAMGVPPATRPAGGPVRGRRGPPPLRPALAIVDVRSGRRRILGSTGCGAGWRSQPFSADGRLLAGGTFCGQVSVWNVATGRKLGKTFSIGGELSRVVFDPAGRRLAVGSWNGTVTVADVATGKIVDQLTGDTSGVTSVAYSRDGRYLATVSLDHSLRVYDSRTLQLLRVRDDPDALDAGLAFAPDSREIVTVDSQNVIRVWDACTDCESPKALLALANRRVTRALTAQEKRTFGVG